MNEFVISFYSSNDRVESEVTESDCHYHVPFMLLINISS
jgi:hypothetical protein